MIYETVQIPLLGWGQREDFAEVTIHIAWIKRIVLTAIFKV